MRIAYFDCFSGASGDMIIGALLDAGLGLEVLKKELAKLKLPDYELRVQSVTKRGLGGSQVFVTVGLSPEFIEGEISTIFLDGKPVDDIDRATLKDGCTLALSAAMPGLVGATLRRGGYYAALRSGISYKGGKESESVAEGTIILKLFNMVASALGPGLLEKGSFVQNDALRDFFKSRSIRFWERCSAESSDGTILNHDDLIGLQQWEP